MAAMKRVYELPYPPSVNHYWRRVGQRMLISRGGRQFRADVRRLVAAVRTEPLTCELRVSIKAHPPDRRRRDLDNLLKSLLDALEHAGVYEDDYQAAKLIIERGAVMSQGKVIVEITEYRPDGVATLST